MCTRPISVPVKYAGRIVDYQTVACGHCEECLNSAALDFMQRVYLESLYFNSVHFVTLTYDNEYLPFQVDKRAIQESYSDRFHRAGVLSDILVCPSLRRKDVISHIKLFRDVIHHQFSYTFIGEYGKLGRPHYHGLFFGLTDTEAKRFCREFWPFGYTDLKPVPLGGSNHSDVSAVGLYVAKYLRKGDFEKPEVLSRSCEAPRPFSSVGLGTRNLDRFRSWYLCQDKYGVVDINASSFPPGFVDDVERRLKRFPIADKVYPVSKFLRHEFLYYDFVDPLSGRKSRRASRLSKVLADRLSLRTDGQLERELQEISLEQNEDLRLAKIADTLRSHAEILSDREENSRSIHKRALQKSSVS